MGTQRAGTSLVFAVAMLGVLATAPAQALRAGPIDGHPDSVPAAGFDFIGPTSATTNWTVPFVAQTHVLGADDYYISAQPWQPEVSTSARELWCVYGDAVFPPSTVSDWRVGIWSSEQAFVLDPLHGDVVDRSYGAPSFGSVVVPFGTNALNADNYLLGFDITGTTVDPGLEYLFAAYNNSVSHVGVGTVVESTVLGKDGIQASVQSGVFDWDSTLNLGATYSGTLAYRLVGEPIGWFDQGCALPGVVGEPQLVGTGTLADGSTNSVDLTNAAPSATAGLLLGLSSTPIPFKGGTIKPFPFFDPVLLSTSAGGTISIPFVMPAGVPAGTELWVQWAIQDAAAIHGVALSNAILGVTP